jgi:hypothetical protein
MPVCRDRSPVVSGADVEGPNRMRPDARVEVVDDAGLSVWSDRPERLAELLEQFISHGPQTSECPIVKPS